MSNKRVFALLAVIFSAYFIIERTFNLVLQVNDNGLFPSISMLVTILTFVVFLIGNLFTVVEEQLSLRGKGFLISAVLFGIVLIISHVNYGTSLTSDLYLRIIISLLSIGVVYIGIDTKRINISGIFVLVLLLMVFLMFFQEVLGGFGSNLSYILGIIGSLTMTTISCWIEIKEQ